MKVPQKPAWTMWDHNHHYYPFLLQQIPLGTQKALDVGCGAGDFARYLAAHVPEVVAVDRDSQMITSARASSPSTAVRYVEADVIDADLPVAGFDFVSCLAALHHMPLQPALQRLGSLVAPGGVLAVLGLYKLATPFDYAYAALTGVFDLAIGIVRHRTQTVKGSGPPLVDPEESLRQIRAATDVALPGAKIRRHMYDRYSLVYSRPSAYAG